MKRIMHVFGIMHVACACGVDKFKLAAFPSQSPYLPSYPHTTEGDDANFQEKSTINHIMKV